jgi:hypothetical protein
MNPAVSDFNSRLRVAIAAIGLLTTAVDGEIAVLQTTSRVSPTVGDPKNDPATFMTSSSQ